MSYPNALTKHGSLLLILLLFTGLTLGYIRAIPLWEAPDEPAHFLYVQHMAEHGEPPPAAAPPTGYFWQNGYITSNYEWHHPPLYYGLVGLLLRANRAIGPFAQYGEFPEVRPGAWGPVRLFAPTPATLSEPYLARAFSLLAGLGTLCIVYATARRLFPAQPALPTLATGTLAFVPQFTFVHAYVTNDGFTFLVSSLGLAALLFTATAEQNESPRCWLISGLFIGLAMAVKLTTWFLLPLGFLLLLMKGVAHLFPGEVRRGDGARYTLGGFLRRGALYVGGVSLFLLLSWLRWPDLEERLFHAFQSGGFNQEYLNVAFVLGLFPLTNASFWGVFGWMNVPLPGPLLWFLSALFGIGILACGVVLLRSWRLLSVGQRQAIVILCVAIALVTASFIAFNFTIRQPQGRLLYPALLAFFTLYALGWAHLLRRAHTWGTALLLTALFLANLYSLLFVLIPSYA